MAIVKKFDARMTVNLEQWKKDKLQAMAAEKKLTDSAYLLYIVDQHLERRTFDSDYFGETNGSANRV